MHMAGSQCRDGDPSSYPPHHLWGWEGDLYTPSPYSVAVSVEKAWHIFASFPSHSHAHCGYHLGVTCLMLSYPTRTAPAVLELVAAPVLCPSHLPTSPWDEQWFAQTGLPVTQKSWQMYPGLLPEGMPGFMSETLWEHLKLSEDRLLKILFLQFRFCIRRRTRLLPWMSRQGQLCRVQKTVV